MSDQPIRLLVGLGNPGDRYAATRHNAGFWLVDRVCARLRVPLKAESRFHGELGQVARAGGTLRLLKPTTFMNHSGRSVSAVAGYFDLAPEAIVIVHDEIDLPPGTIRVKRGGGHGGHNGLRDIVPALGSADFYRIRVGVGHPGSREQVVGYVLGRAGREEQADIEASLERVIDHLDDLLDGRIERAMAELNRRPERPTDSPSGPSG